MYALISCDLEKVAAELEMYYHNLPSTRTKCAMTRGGLSDIEKSLEEAVERIRAVAFGLELRVIPHELERRVMGIAEEDFERYVEEEPGPERELPSQLVAEGVLREISRVLGRDRKGKRRGECGIRAKVAMTSHGNRSGRSASIYISAVRGWVQRLREAATELGHQIREAVASSREVGVPCKGIVYGSARVKTEME